MIVPLSAVAGGPFEKTSGITLGAFRLENHDEVVLFHNLPGSADDHAG